MSTSSSFSFADVSACEALHEANPAEFKNRLYTRFRGVQTDCRRSMSTARINLGDDIKHIFEYYLRYLREDPEVHSTEPFCKYERFTGPYKSKTFIRPDLYHCLCKIVCIYRPEVCKDHVQIMVLPWSRLRVNGKDTTRMCPIRVFEANATGRPEAAFTPCDIVAEYPTKTWAMVNANEEPNRDCQFGGVQA